MQGRTTIKKGWEVGFEIVRGSWRFLTSCTLLMRCTAVHCSCDVSVHEADEDD